MLKSHAYPHFIIYNIGLKLTATFGEKLGEKSIEGLSYGDFLEEIGNLGVDPKRISRCYELYQRWMETPHSFL
jgi:hypothetical protein